MPSSEFYYKRKLELASNIMQELKLLNDKYNPSIVLNNKKYQLSHITPRLLCELGLQTIIIKPSAYQLGVIATIREIMSNRKGKLISGEYFYDLGSTTTTGLMPMLYTHPLGDGFKRAMTGYSNIFLINGTVEKLKELKKSCRNTLGKNVMGKESLWVDNEKILWDPFVLNLVHSTDNYPEACLHYLSGYPEHQLMTRFMYPNPKLEKRLK